jgi:sugar/nucleoside kinase (ribokinase family)
MRQIIVCGHLCLDLLPGMPDVTLEAMSAPGHLSEIGPLMYATGGCVSNTGLALKIMGADVQLIATAGDDVIGDLIVAVVRRYGGEALARGLVRLAGRASSYTVVLAPAGTDRIFLHCTGTNADFGLKDIDPAQIQPGALFHFGYPTILPRMYADDGAELAQVIRMAKARGAVTSMDCTLPDAASSSGRADWRRILAGALPFTDVFMPSLEEALFMLRRPLYERWRTGDQSFLTRALAEEIADELLTMGAAAAGLKMGERGLLLKLAPADVLSRRLGDVARSWLPDAGRCASAPAFEVIVAGTTGAGDAAYAGLLFALVQGLSLDQAVQMACAAGAHNVEAVDALSGLRSWSTMRMRVERGWKTREPLPG